MEKIVKSYLMFYRTRPFACCVVIGIVSFMLTFAVAIAIDLPERFDNVALVFVSICLVIAVTILAAISLAAKKKITVPVNELSEGRPYNLFEVLVLEDGKRVVLDRPVWGKGQVYLIKKPSEIWGNDEIFRIKTCLSIKHRCITVVIPVTLTLTLSGPMHKLEVFDALFESQFGRDLDIEKYLAEAFSKANLDNQVLFEQLAEEYLRKTISYSEMLCTLTNSLIFPKAALSNIARFDVVLEKPTFSSHREVLL